MRTLVAVAVVVVVLAAGCTSGESAPVVESSSSTTAATVASTTVPSTTTTTVPSTVTTPMALIPEPHTLEPLAGTLYETAALEWRNTGVTFERRRSEQYWVGSVGDRFVFVEFDWPSGGLVVSTSEDGSSWESASLPETIGAGPVPIDELSVLGVAAAEAGVIIALGSDPTGYEQTEPVRLLVSTDGRTFAESDVSTLRGTPVPNSDAIAAGPTGFALITEERVSRGDPDNWLYLSEDGEHWRLIDIPDASRDLWWVMALGDGWMAKGPHHGNRYPVYVVGPGGAAVLRTAPWDFFPQSWGSQALMHAYTERLVADHLGEAPSFYATTDAQAWWRLPFPDQGPFGDQDYAAWYVETIAGNPDGQLLVLGCGDGCVGMWEFYGDSFAPVTVENNGWTVEIWGDYVSYSNGSTWGSIQDASNLYDPASETLTIVDGRETIASISCDEMRQAAADLEWPTELGGLTELPDEALWHSYNGTSWHEQAVDDLFGAESYVFAAAATSEHALAIVTPNGDRYVADPLGCQLDLYPEEQPLEVWVAELPNTRANTFPPGSTMLAPVGALDAGLYCRDLSALGYGYEDAVAYWLSKGSPDRMDADLNGIPCQTVYPEADVLRYWGEPLPVKPTEQFAYITIGSETPPWTIVADYADFLLDDEAEQACREDGMDSYCPWEGYYYIRNVNPRLRTLDLTDETAIFLVDWRMSPASESSCMPGDSDVLRAVGFTEHPTSVCRASITDLLDAFLPPADGPAPRLLVWLITDGDRVIAIEEQYTP